MADATVIPVKQESRLRALVDTAVDGVILIDALGVVKMFNPACERLFGYGAEEIIGQSVKLLFARGLTAPALS
jgi:PAS domain S-box-containing protein